MSDLRMDAYYYSFDRTGVVEIDRILSAVACAGKAYHGTDQWEDATSPYPGHVGATPVEWIQSAANDAAKALAASTTTPAHPTQDLYEHFLSYSGLADDAMLRYAYFHGADSDCEKPSALPVAQGEAVSKEPSPEFTEWLLREIPPGTVISSPKWWLPKIWRRATDGLYAAPPASRIAELEREAERLREALESIDRTSKEALGSKGECGRIARKALAAQEKNDA